MLSALTLLILLPSRHVPALLLQQQVQSEPVKVLVFGDSWGALGPGWSMIYYMFRRHNVRAKVMNLAVSGSTACQWANKPYNLAKAAKIKFPHSAPDFVWFTLGGNDLLTRDYYMCSNKATTYEEAIVCVENIAAISRECNVRLLQNFYEEFPQAGVVQCGYDFECVQGSCIPSRRWPFCQTNVTCITHMAMHWATTLVMATEKLFNDKNRFKGISIQGACQKAGGMNVTIGQGDMNQGSPCNLMLNCEHPAPYSPAAWTIGEIFWEEYFKDRVTPSSILLQSVPPVSANNHGWEWQTPTDFKDLECNQNWFPDLEDIFMAPPPCNRTIEDPFTP